MDDNGIPSTQPPKQQSATSKKSDTFTAPKPKQQSAASKKSEFSTTQLPKQAANKTEQVFSNSCFFEEFLL